jgi:hypothetical protein
VESGVELCFSAEACVAATVQHRVGDTITIVGIVVAIFVAIITVLVIATVTVIFGKHESADPPRTE